MHPVAVALIPILATVALTYYAFSRQLPFDDRFTLHALVANSVNVRADSPVRIAGIDVGTVQATSSRGRSTEITFTVSPQGRPIHTDATIRIRDRLFLEGGYYLQLDPGTPGAPIASSGYTFAASHTSSPVQLFQVLSTFDNATRANLTGALDTLSGALGATRSRPTGAGSGAYAIKRAIGPLAGVLEDVAIGARALTGTRPGDVRNVLTGASNVSSTLAGASAELVALVHALHGIATSLAATDGALAGAVSGLDGVLRKAPPALSSIDTSLPPVTRLAAALDPSLRLAPPFLAGAERAVAELAADLAPAERGPLLSSLDTAFTQLPALISSVGGALSVTQSLTDCLRTHIAPMLHATVPDGALSTGRPVWQDLVHALPGLASIGQNFDGNGYWARLLVGAGTNTIALGSIPSDGPLFGTTPSSSPILGARPVWHGDLTSDAFHPEASCADQPLPGLSAPAAASDMRTIGTGRR
jgi:ABC-type transporter Mla subunit MlaD